MITRAFTQICLHVPESRSKMRVKVVVEQRLDLHVDVRLQAEQLKHLNCLYQTLMRPVE